MSDLTIIESFDIGEETANEIADQFSENMGLIRDLTFDGRYYLVRWNDDADSTTDRSESSEEGAK